MTTEREVILVNDQDEAIGTMEKMQAHLRGVLHRAFSVFIFNSKGQMLLQQRAYTKYHSGGLWTNACCSHPQPGEETTDAAMRRLQEEMGFTVPLKKVFQFTYRSELDNGLIEYEFDHVFAGYYDGPVTPDKNEVQDYRYKNMEVIRERLESHPEHFTVWFRIAFPRVYHWMKEEGIKSS